jgi:nucleoside-diphosphate-sugar epimerase
MKILVTGSEGNIGRKLVPFLQSKGHEVYCIDQVQAWKPGYSVVNILSPVDLQRVFSDFRPEVVYHLAAMVSRVTCEASPSLAIDVNVSGTSNVVLLCKQYGAKLIHFSTSEVYGNIGGVLHEDRECKPNNLYGVTKLLSESVVKYHLKDAIIVRPFMFYDEDETRGDHRSAMIRFCTDLSQGKKIQVHKGSVRSWMHISDGVRVLEKLIYVKGPETVNIGSVFPVHTKGLAMIICEALNINYGDLIEEVNQPDRMTLEKIPDVTKQRDLTGISPQIGIVAGVRLVLNNINRA